MNDAQLLLGRPEDGLPSAGETRYQKAMQALMFERLKPRLVEGVRILDLGGGRNPFLPPELRPAGTRYVGSDIVDDELRAAPEGTYDHTFVADVCRGLSTDEQFDIVLSWQVLEHVPSMPAALQNIRDVLKPGGWTFNQLSGSRAFYAVLTRLIPHGPRVKLMSRLLDEPEEDHFPTVYDRCVATELRDLLAGWSSAEVVPYFRGGSYFEFNKLAQRGYLNLENVIANIGRDNFATHYLIVAQR